MKIRDKIVTGRQLPRHLQIAWGRHIFRLMHGGRNCGLWLRDLPLSMFDLAHEYGFHEPYREYLRECVRTGQAPQV